MYDTLKLDGANEGHFVHEICLLTLLIMRQIMRPQLLLLLCAATLSVFRVEGATIVHTVDTVAPGDAIHQETGYSGEYPPLNRAVKAVCFCRSPSDLFIRGSKSKVCPSLARCPRR